MLAPLLTQDQGRLISRLAVAKQEKHKKKQEAQTLEKERHQAVKQEDAKLARAVAIKKVSPRSPEAHRAQQVCMPIQPSHTSFP